MCWLDPGGGGAYVKGSTPKGAALHKRGSTPKGAAKPTAGSRTRAVEQPDVLVANIITVLSRLGADISIGNLQ